MQTFLPYASSEKTGWCLDLGRLGNQLMESQQIHKSLFDPEYGHRNHPIKNMWRGHECALLDYTLTLGRIWLIRRPHDRPHGSIANIVQQHSEYTGHAAQVDCAKANRKTKSLDKPRWWGDERLHSIHRSNLLFKDPYHYGRFSWPEQPQSGGYIYPDSGRND